MGRRRLPIVGETEWNMKLNFCRIAKANTPRHPSVLVQDQQYIYIHQKNPPEPSSYESFMSYVLTLPGLDFDLVDAGSLPYTPMCAGQLLIRGRELIRVGSLRPSH